MKSRIAYKRLFPIFVASFNFRNTWKLGLMVNKSTETKICNVHDNLYLNERCSSLMLPTMTPD